MSLHAGLRFLKPGVCCYVPPVLLPACPQALHVAAHLTQHQAVGRVFTGQLATYVVDNKLDVLQDVTVPVRLPGRWRDRAAFQAGWPWSPA